MLIPNIYYQIPIQSSISVLDKIHAFYISDISIVRWNLRLYIMQHYLWNSCIIQRLSDIY